MPARAQVLTKAPKGDWSSWLANALHHHGTTRTTANAGRAWLIWGSRAQVENEVHVEGGWPGPIRSDATIFPPVPGRVWARSLTLTIFRFAGYRGPTFVTVQAQESYIRVPPRSAVLPSHIDRIDITSRYGTSPPRVLVHVSDRVKIASIVSWMNGLGARRPIPWCAGFFGYGPVVRLTFRSASGDVLARVRILSPFESDDCGDRLRLTIGAQAPVPLNAAQFLDHVQPLLGVELAPVSPGAVSGCLRREGWVAHVHRRPPIRIVAIHRGRTWTITFPLNRKPTPSRPLPFSVAFCLTDPTFDVIYANASSFVSARG